MSDFETIRFDLSEGVATITLDRPEKYNAVNHVMHGDLRAALKLVRKEGARALVITGGGEKAFCSGQDLTEFGQQPEGFRVDDHVRTTFNPLVKTLRELPIPVIAAVNGVAAGAGASLALACDIRLMADTAVLMQAFVKIGLVPDTGSTWFLPHLIGVPRALELAWTGDPVDAQTAVDLGLASRVVPAGELADETRKLATRLASMPTRTLGLTKKAIYRAVTSTLDEALEYEAQLQHAIVRSEDHMEGVMAFFEKRDPVFVGR
jgi:2-(1,2-epoxy-1,2-dihydrophenyl)acetyl-CoA isomerase